MACLRCVCVGWAACRVPLCRPSAQHAMDAKRLHEDPAMWGGRLHPDIVTCYLCLAQVRHPPPPSPLSQPLHPSPSLFPGYGLAPVGERAGTDHPPSVVTSPPPPPPQLCPPSSHSCPRTPRSLRGAPSMPCTQVHKAMNNIEEAKVSAEDARRVAKKLYGDAPSRDVERVTVHAPTTIPPHPCMHAPVCLPHVHTHRGAHTRTDELGVVLLLPLPPLVP
jgi:hypothetical protein